MAQLIGPKMQAMMRPTAIIEMPGKGFLSIFSSRLDVHTYSQRLSSGPEMMNVITAKRPNPNQGTAVAKPMRNELMSRFRCIGYPKFASEVRSELRPFVTCLHNPGSFRGQYNTVGALV